MSRSASLTMTAFTPPSMVGRTYGEYCRWACRPLLPSGRKRDMTPHKRSAQSLGRNGLPLLVTPWIKKSREAIWAEVSKSVMYAACLGSQGLRASNTKKPRASCGRGGACQRANPTRPDECNADYALKTHQGRITPPASACHSDLLRFYSIDDE